MKITSKAIYLIACGVCFSWGFAIATLMRVLASLGDLSLRGARVLATGASRALLTNN
jgi:hypothetical protein